MNYFDQYKDKNILSIALAGFLIILATIIIDIIVNVIFEMNISYELIIFLIPYVLFFCFILSKTKKDNVSLKLLIGNPKSYFFIVDVIILFVLIHFLTNSLGVIYDNILYYINKDFAIESLKNSIERNNFELNYNINFLILCISVVLGAPIIEEIVFRGMILQKFNYKYRPLKAILLSSFLFAIIHLDIYVYPYFLGGVSLCLLTYKYKSLIPAMFLHFVNNTASILLGDFPGEVIKIEDYNNVFIESIEYMKTFEFWILLFTSLLLYFGYIYLNRKHFKIISNREYI